MSPHAPGAGVAVVGGGIAGLAAATILAERGLTPTVFEREASFGGRLRSWPVTLPDGTTLAMERGFHAFFRQYYNLRALMRRWDPALESLMPLLDDPILGPEGLRMRFDRLPKKSPWNVAAVALRGSRWLGLRALARIDVRQALLMLAWDEGAWARLDHLSAAQFLDGLRFPPDARRMLFDVFAHSFFNPEGDMSAAELLMMFHFYFTGNPEGLVFDVLRDPFEKAFVAPWLAALGRLGARLRPATAVAELGRDGDGFRVNGERFAGLVLATDVAGLHAVAAHSDILTPRDRARVASLDRTAPFAVLRLWLDRPTAPEREPFVGTAGLGHLDNISCFHLFEAESRDWAAHHHGAVVELHAYGVDALTRKTLDEPQLEAELVAQLHALYPETRAANVVHKEWLVASDCPAFRPGSRALRPGVATETPGLALAGDFVALPFPSALMERAATSGILAANVLLERAGKAPERIATVPPRGLLAPFRNLFGA
ncbi:MAG: FAD-dependent oxidoreductase [Myxococcota bacterium]